MATEFDPNNYTSVPSLNAALTLALTRQLIMQMSEELATEPLVVAAAERMRLRGSELRAERLKAIAPTQKVDTRPLDQGEDRAWRGVSDRLSSYADLGVADAARAGEILNRLFPNGLAFLVFKYREQWTESERLLNAIDKENLGAELDKFCGPEFLAELRRAHTAYGDALGLTKAKVVPEAAAIADALQALRRGIRFYARRVVAWVDDEEAPHTVDVAMRALQPLIDERQNARRRQTSGQPEPEPPDEGELPPVPEL